MATYVAPLPLIVGPARETSRFGTRDGFHGVEDLSSCTVRECRSLSPSCEGSRIVQMAHAFAHYRWSLEITLQSCRVDIPWARMHRFRPRHNDKMAHSLCVKRCFFGGHRPSSSHVPVFTVATLGAHSLHLLPLGIRKTTQSLARSHVIRWPVA